MHLASKVDIDELRDAAPAAAKAIEQEYHNPKHLERQQHQRAVFLEKTAEQFHDY